MLKNWCDMKNKEAQERIDKALKVIDDFIVLRKDDYDTSSFWYKDYIEKGRLTKFRLDDIVKPYLTKRPYDDEDIDEIVEKYNLKKSLDVLVHYSQYWNLRKPYLFYNYYLDSDWISFDGDIVITDPTYYLKIGARKEIVDYLDDTFPVTIFNCYNFKNSVFSTSLVNQTYCGDWERDIKLKESDENIGHFCADGGHVSVTYVSETEKYNSEWNQMNSNAYAVIKDFKGRIKFEITGDKWLWEDKDTGINEERLCSKLTIIGEGINSKTGETLDFYTC